MQRRWLAGIAIWLIAIAGACGKPADLPAANPVECRAVLDDPPPRRLQFDLDITSKGITLKVGIHAAPIESTPSLDALLPAFIEQWLQHTADALTQPGRAMHWSRLLGPVAPLHRWWTGGASDGAEESEPDDPEAVFEDMRRWTIPLGLVEVSY